MRLGTEGSDKTMAASDAVYTIEPFKFLITGKVVNGDKVGRTIGFPTANLNVNMDEAQLPPGVYLAKASFKDKGETVTKHGLAYFGPRYVLGEKINSFEVFLYDFNNQIYGVVMTVTLTHFMRKPIDIKSWEELKSQLEMDKSQGERLLKKQ